MVTLIYDSMWHSTEHMANAIIAGLHEADPTLQVKVHSLGRGDANDALTDAFRSQLVLIGSPTVNGGVLSTVAALLSQLTEMKWKGKKAAAFGAYGWSGEGVKHINEQLAKAGMDVVHEGVRATWDPDNDALAACRALGAELGKML